MRQVNVIEPEEQLKMYKDFKSCLMHLDYEDVKLQSSYRKLRHHLDMLIVMLEEKKQK